MKQLLITLISVYQLVLSPLFKHILGVKTQCRYSPSCSVYAKNVIKQFGVIKGTSLALMRLLRCQPFSKTHEYTYI